MWRVFGVFWTSIVRHPRPSTACKAGAQDKLQPPAEGGDPSPDAATQDPASGDGFPPARERRNFVPIVFDPVMVATSGSTLADSQTIAAFEKLMRIATLITPNIPELAALGGDAMASRFGCTVLAKGGHADGDILVDRLFDASGEIARWEDARIDTPHTHGTGCTLASGIATGLGQGMNLVDAIARARQHVRAALIAAPGLGKGHGPMGVPRGGNIKN